ncbi:MAG: bifunctional UDP-N-acetylglucosamine diphosphorylase/glucosamine-1-phosphate N-acetyltransferase GlmU, partial [Deltaproteobacteria bacterium]|nr:bifunctional UDP-N-acetylglucosamine diphosphorylase/glucosamine-1-phosphate N-acetyltransferase GlmU [Deltaproteobacteria bacterium]
MRRSDITAVILAAGEGKRMHSALPKCLHPVAGLPMLEYALRAMEEVEGIERIAVVVSPANRDVIEGFLKERDSSALPQNDRSAERVLIETVVQPEPEGTGSALRCALREEGIKGTILVMGADSPLITTESLTRLVKTHLHGQAVLSLLTTRYETENSYGRILRDERGKVVRIVEAADCSEDMKKIAEINSGVYCMESEAIMPLLEDLRQHNAQAEYYLTDLIEMCVKKGLFVADAQLEEWRETLGINNRSELAIVEHLMRMRVIDRLMKKGVTVVHPAVTYIDATVVIGKESVIHPGVRLLGKTTMGENCIVEAYSTLRNVSVGSGCHVKESCVLEEAVLEAEVTVGPFAHLRPGTLLHRGARVGNFVEVKKSTLGPGSKANHLAYIGDAEVGRNANIGAGVI